MIKLTQNEIASLAARGLIHFPEPKPKRGPKPKLPRKLYLELYRKGYRARPVTKP